MKISLSREGKTLRTAQMKKAPSRTTNRDIERIVRSGAQRLFAQFHSSEGYTSYGDSELAEAAIVAHIASAFIQENHAVWPESPFKTKKRRASKAKKSKRRVANHLDLIIHLWPEHYSAPSIITFEAKAIGPGSVSGKLKEVLKDWKRICQWKALGIDGRPLHFAHSSPKTVRGLLAVLITEEIDVATKDVPSNFLSRSWDRSSGPIAGAKSPLTKRVKKMLSASVLHRVIESPYKDGGLKRSVAYAIFPC